MHNISIDRKVVKDTNQSINYSALFTGEAKLTPVAVNPTKEEIIELKDMQNIADSVKDPNYVDLTLKSGAVMSVVDFYFTVDPIDNFGNNAPKGQSFKDNIVVNLPIMISKERDFTKKGDKIRVIDQHNQSMYVPYVEGLTVLEMIDQYHTKLTEENGSQYLITMCENICKESVRHACIGEILLYDTIQSLTVLAPHNATKIDGEPVPLNGFVIGGDITPDAATEQFHKIVDGDVSMLKTIMGSDICKYSDGNTVQVYGLLGVREYDGKFYQDLYRNPREKSIFSDKSRLNDYKEGKSRISQRLHESLTHDEYGWTSFWNNSFKFKLFDASQLSKPSNEVDTSGEDDDLPF